MQQIPGSTHLRQELVILGAVQDSGIDKGWYHDGALRELRQPQRLLYPVADVELGVGGVPQALADIDGGEVGCAAVPQPHQLLVLGLGLVGAASRVAGLTPLAVVTVWKEVETPEVVGPQAQAQLEGLLHEVLGRLLKLGLCHVSDFVYWQ